MHIVPAARGERANARKRYLGAGKSQMMVFEIMVTGDLDLGESNTVLTLIIRVSLFVF